MIRCLYVAWIAAVLMVFCGTAAANDDGSDKQKIQTNSGVVDLLKGKASAQNKEQQANARFDASTNGKIVTKLPKQISPSEMTLPDRVVKMNPRFVSYLGPMGQSRDDDQDGNSYSGSYHSSIYPDFYERLQGWRNAICRPAFNDWCQQECGDASPTSGSGSNRWGHHCTPGKMELCNACGFLD